MRILMTGAGGFVGPYLTAALQHDFGADLDLMLTSRSADLARDGRPIHVLDVCNRKAVDRAIADFRPHHVVHLAGLAAVPSASANMRLAWRVHVEGTLNVATAIMRHVPACTLLYVGSGQIYGDSAKAGAALTEESLPSPTNVYGATKAAADLALGALAADGLRCIRLRPFNHTGPGQSEEFAVPSFAMQIARIEAGQAEPVVRVGNLGAERDFLDVRDVAAAYALAVAKSDELPGGVILNIASGRPRKIETLLELLLSRSRVRIAVEKDVARFRAVDVPRFIGDATRAQKLLGWRPRYAVDATVADVLNHCRMQLGLAVEEMATRA